MITKHRLPPPFKSPEGRYLAVLPTILCLALFWPFGSGGKKIQMNSAQEVPAARGEVQAKNTSNGNTKVDIKVRALARPSALAPPKDIYVVWIQSPGQDPVNEGALKVDSDLNGEMTTVTPYKDFKVFITAEKFAQVERPEGPTVLSAQVAAS